MTTKDSRAEFEAWLRTSDTFEMCWLNRRDMQGSLRFGQYCNNSIEWQWRAWQACEARMRESVPTASQYLDSQRSVACKDWQAGWDACRDEFCPPPIAADHQEGGAR